MEPDKAVRDIPGIGREPPRRARIQDVSCLVSVQENVPFADALPVQQRIHFLAMIPTNPDTQPSANRDTREPHGSPKKSRLSVEEYRTYGEEDPAAPTLLAVLRVGVRL